MKSANQRINQVFKAIADPTRREIFHALVVASVAMPITQISEQFDISRQGVTKHIKTLEEAGLINIDTKGRERFCTADPKPLKMVFDWVGFYDKFWDDALNRLDDHLG
ncbi:transcriptional regulator, ArsR family [Ekhidna lutea]|uniref:Transcriptional regulator, ArsR family n=1 Tax=Ekhidna lutea TaxID=447679 RepID=A0A239J1V7_EKHLU|nr:metalloregulator ArsR/SmtB family transcription factor [Ekhidna lutea]SNT00016.1 transcriptional regulator, ArsR family [Ekhidna lutea]